MDFLADECARRHVPGVSLSTIEDGCVSATHCFGFKVGDDPVVEDTVFEAASMSKPMMAKVALHLVGEGRLSLDEPLVRYTSRRHVDDPRIDIVTARHALTHQSGLWRDSNDSAPYFERDPLIDFKYSNEGVEYVQAVTEDISGESLEALARRIVFAPLGMTDSSFVWRDDYETKAATPHDSDGNATEKWRPTESDGAGSLHTTAADYARFVAATMTSGGEWLTPQIEVHEAWGGGPPEPGSTWGLGWGLQSSDGSFWHWGWNNGFLSFAVGWPEQGRGVVVFTNGDNGLWICKAVVRRFSDSDHPSFKWLEH
jgi:CubicO group peptidase (beta-lactamase class C family)